MDAAIKAGREKEDGREKGGRSALRRKALRPPLSPGNIFAANISMPDAPNNGGTFGFLQVFNTRVKRTQMNTTTKMEYTQNLVPSGVWLLDRLPNQSILMKGWESVEFAAGAQNKVLPIDGWGQDHPPYSNEEKAKYIQDSPHMNGDPPDYVAGLDYITKMEMDTDFQTFLLFKASGDAVYAGISRIEWQFKATASFNGQGGGSAAYYLNPNNWVIAANPIPAEDDSETGTNGTYVTSADTTWVGRRVMSWN